MKVKRESEVAQLCPTPSDPTDCSPPGSSVHGILQARALEWVAIAFSLPHCRQTLYRLSHQEVVQNSLNLLAIIWESDRNAIGTHNSQTSDLLNRNHGRLRKLCLKKLSK